MSAVGRAGLEALDYLDAGNPAPEAWVQEQFVLLDLAAKPRAELLLMIVAPVRKLLETAQRGSWLEGEENMLPRARGREVK